jgi:hypothetical protein
LITTETGLAVEADASRSLDAKEGGSSDQNGGSPPAPRSLAAAYIWLALAALIVPLVIWGFFFDRSVRDDPFDPHPTFVQWLLQRGPDPGISAMPVVPIGIRGWFVFRPTHTDWINKGESDLGNFEGLTTGTAGEVTDVPPVPGRDKLFSPLDLPPAQFPPTLEQALAADSASPHADAAGDGAQYACQFGGDLCLALKNGVLYGSTSGGKQWSIAASQPPNPEDYFATTRDLGLVEFGDGLLAAVSRSGSLVDIGMLPPGVGKGDSAFAAQRSPTDGAVEKLALFYDAQLSGAAVHTVGRQRYLQQYDSSTETSLALDPVLANPVLQSSARTIFLRVSTPRTLSPSGTSYVLYDVDAFVITSGNTVYELSYTGDRLKAKEPALVTFRKLAIPATGELEDVFFDGSDGWITTGWPTDGGRPQIVQTIDGGLTWTLLSYSASPAPWVYLLLPLALLAVSQASLALVRVGSLGKLVWGIAPELGSDAPIGWADRDVLGLKPLARALSMFVRNTDTQPPLTIAVHGTWGSGKSSLMNLVAADIRERGAQPVMFNAWHHQSEENVLAALLENIRAQTIPPAWSASGLIFRSRLLAGRIGRNVLPVILAVALLTLAIAVLTTSPLGAVVIGALGRLVEQVAKLFGASGEAWVDALGRIAEDIGLPAGLLATVLVFLRLSAALNLNPSNLMATLRRNSKVADFEAQLSFRFRFAKEFDDVARALRRRTNPGLVIFIDDLDRCAPDAAMEILEAVSFLISAGPCFVFLGLDRLKVEQMVAAQLTQKKIADVAGPDLDRAKLYLKKLINLSVHVPPLGAEGGLVLLRAPPRRRAGAPLRSAARRVLRAIPDLVVPSLLLAVVIGLLATIGTWPATPSSPSVAIADPVSPAPSLPSSLPSTAPPISPTEPTSPPSSSSEAVTPIAPLAPLQSGFSWWLLVPAGVAAVIALLLWVRQLTVAADDAVSDSQEFTGALQVWHQVLYRADPTPRGVKRIQNRLRLVAMQMRPQRDDAQGALDENPDPTPRPFPAIADRDLVALAAVQALIGAIPEWVLGRAPSPLDEPANEINAAIDAARRSGWPPDEAVVKGFCAATQEQVD